MTNKAKHESSGITLVEAVETLSSIADLDFEHETAIAQPHHLILDEQKINYRTVHWLHRKGGGESIEMIKEIFRVVLNHLRQFYSLNLDGSESNQTVEGIKTVMVLVGEAAKKLDRYTGLYMKGERRSVTDLREFKELQDFYHTRIDRKVDEGLLGKWLLALAKKTWEAKPKTILKKEEPVETKHVFVDLDSVKRDSEYELFLMRKEDGTRFFNPRLIRNIKLVCDFGNLLDEKKRAEDLLVDVSIWLDKGYAGAAKAMLRGMGNRLQRFYHEAYRFKDHEVVEHINKALMALMLAANPGNTLRDPSIKHATDYFIDFQCYLRDAIHSVDYIKWITYPPKSGNRLAHCVLDTIHSLCRVFFNELHIHRDLAVHVSGIIRQAMEMRSKEHQEAAARSKTIWNYLAAHYAALVKPIGIHAYGPLVKVLDVLSDSGRFVFDPLLQGLPPSNTYAVYFNETKMDNIQLPSPVVQEFIDKAPVCDEFKAYLRGSAHQQQRGHHVLFNLQDRTSWREHARCQALEELQHAGEFQGTLTVITLSKDTEFYHQLPPYNADGHSDIFINHFKEHLFDESAGFYFSDGIKKMLFPHFINHLMEGIHRIFFSGKNVLTREQRMDFIEIAYFFIELKVLDLLRPETFSLMCKDGIDIGSTANAGFLAFLKLIRQEEIIPSDLDRIDAVLHGPALMIREREVHPDRFNRMLSAIKSVESVRSQLGGANFAMLIRDTFGTLYESGVFELDILYPR